MLLRGRVWKVGSNMKAGGDIFPTEYDHLASSAKFRELAAHVFETVLPEFAARVQKGDLIVAGANFGAGHSHFLMSAVNALAATGLGGCIAESYSGAFQRRAINAGFPAIEARDVVAQTGDEIEVNVLTGEGRNITRGLALRARPVPQMIVDLLQAGGLEPYALNRLRSPA